MMQSITSALTMSGQVKPVLIFQFASNEGPGYLADFFDAESIPWQLLRVNEGEALPSTIKGYSGVVLMGGLMRVNDALPWIAPVLDLILEAQRLDIPLLGHGLGAQLITKALGGAVSASPIKEIGWGEVNVLASDVAKCWFGELETFNAFHWHDETFSLPRHAVHLLSSPYCAHQAYALGKHLALQCHLEMTPTLVQAWCDVRADALAEALEHQHDAKYQQVQHPSQILETLPLHCFFLNKVAKRIYMQWIKGLVF